MSETSSIRADFYVAVNGDDANPGTEEKPFATLARARDAVRELKKENPITVLVRGGTYYLDEPLVFGSQDAPATYAAYPGEFVARVQGRGLEESWDDSNWERRTVPVRRKYSLEEWQALGFDQHSVFADPMFVDPENGDYHVKPESPALKLGLENFDVSGAGLTPDFPGQWLG
jgi:hypothetical protein